MKIGIICFLLLALSACSNSQRVTQQPAMPESGLSDYLIGVGDRLSIRVWKSPELSIDVPVRPDGKISVPLIGDIYAANKSTEELSKSLSVGFGKYIRSAQVTVVLTDPSSGVYLRRVRVTGAVDRPLSLPHKQGLSVLDLVLEAGGTTQFANGNRAKLYRRVDGEIQVFPINLSDILEKGDLETNYLLAPADIVTVPERSF